MSNLLEVLVSCDSNNALCTCSIMDPNTGTTLMIYKGGGTSENRTLSFIGDDYIASVEQTKPILHVWPLNSRQTVQGMRFILPGKATAFAVSPDGAYAVAGIEDKIYLWQIASGNLLTIIHRHYQKVNILKFTKDSRYFVSAAEDGMVMVWSLAMVTANPEIGLVIQDIAGRDDPIYVFSDHSLPVTDMCISKMGLRGRLFTVSSDRSCKVYDLTSGEILLNLVFDESLSSISLDVLELNIFIGSAEGKIFEISLTKRQKGRDLLVDGNDTSRIFSGHNKAVTCLSVSLNGDKLMSGGKDEQVILWHIRSRQPVRIIKHKGQVTNAFFSPNYAAIYKQDFSPNIILHSFERTLEGNNDEINEVEVLMNTKTSFWPQYNEDNEDGMATKELDIEVRHNEAMLREELQKLKQINASLYALATQKLIVSVPIQNTKTSKKKRKNKA